MIDPASPIASRVSPERESLERVARMGIPTVRAELVATADDAAAAASRIGFPAIVKVDAAGLAHKSDVGAVRLGLPDPDAVRAAARDLLALTLPAGARRRGLVVAAEMAGIELIVGARRDPSFGPVVLVGLGGILAEAIDDVAVRLAPLDAEEASSMLDELRGRAVLAGVRGRPGIDRAAIIAAIVALGAAMVTEPTLLEVDLNPVISGPSGTAAVDALVVEAVR